MIYDGVYHASLKTEGTVAATWKLYAQIVAFVASRFSYSSLGDNALCTRQRGSPASSRWCTRYLPARNLPISFSCLRENNGRRLELSSMWLLRRIAYLSDEMIPDASLFWIHPSVRRYNEIYCKIYKNELQLKK